MISAEVDGVQYQVRFRHRQFPAPVVWRDHLIRAATSAKVNGSGRGVARCSATDAFCYDTGRKLALTRALVEFPKPVRAAIWKAYFERQ